METITKIYPLVNPMISNILIVDDVPANLQILCSILEREGYKVRPVTSGKLALQVVEKMKPDLILLDIMMQGMDGFEVCRKLKENPDLAEIPVVFISALNDTSDIVKALNSGGVDYITKPFHAEEVIARVKTHLQLYLQKKELHEQRVVLQRLNSEK
ncbi:MAG: response regulator, partial [Prolixibacteraceae bacterium]